MRMGRAPRCTSAWEIHYRDGGVGRVFCERDEHEGVPHYAFVGKRGYVWEGETFIQKGPVVAYGDIRFGQTA